MKLTIPQVLESEMAKLLKRKKQENIEAIIQIKFRNPVEYEKQRAQIESRTIEDGFLEMLVKEVIQINQNDLKASLEADYDTKSKVIQDRFSKVFKKN